MQDGNKTKKQLIDELTKARLRIRALEGEEERNIEALGANDDELDPREKRFRELIEHGSDIITVLESEGTFRYLSPSCERVLGYQPAELQDKRVFDFIHPEDAERIRRILDSRMQQPDLIKRIELRFRHSDGSWRTLESVGRNLLHDGAVGGVIINSRDITERKQAEQALIQSEKRFRNIVESSPMGIHMYRLEPDDRLVFIGANPAADRLLGLDNAQFIGKTIEEAFPSMKGSELPDRYRRAARTGKPWNWEQFEYQDEQIIGAFEVYAFQTSPGRMAALFLDVTERKQVEAALKDSEEKYRHLVENINDVIFAIDKNGIFTYIGPTIEAFTGFQPNELVGQPFMNFIYPDDRPQISKRFEQRMAGEVSPAEYRILTKSGGVRWVRSSSRPLASGTGILGLQGVLVDITEAKKAEAERKQLETQLRHAQKMEAIGQLAGGVAHDFNNLLSPILGYAELLLMELHPDDPRYGSVAEIHKAGNLAKDLTRQLLAFGRKQVFEMIPFELNDVVSAFEKMLRRTIREDIQMELALSRSISPVRGDISMIEQVLMNLAINAQDAMPNGGTLSIVTDEVVIDNDFARKHPQIQPDRYVTLTVRDTGSGIEKKHFEHLFEPFFTTKEKGKGTGLGLATVYGIVKQHNGVILFESTLDIGTAFTIYLPRTKDSAEQQPVHGPATARAGNYGSETVVVVEDDQMVRTLTCTILEDHGYRVYSAGNAKECMNLIEGLTQPVDILVTDIVMPGMNGRELYFQLAKTDPGLNVLFMSGYMDKLSTNGEALGNESNFIQKPFSVEHFTRKVREVLES